MKKLPKNIHKKLLYSPRKPGDYINAILPFPLRSCQFEALRKKQKEIVIHNSYKLFLLEPFFS